MRFWLLPRWFLWSSVRALRSFMPGVKWLAFRLLQTSFIISTCVLFLLRKH